MTEINIKKCKKKATYCSSSMSYKSSFGVPIAWGVPSFCSDPPIGAGFLTGSGTGLGGSGSDSSSVSLDSSIALGVSSRDIWQLTWVFRDTNCKY